MISCPSYPDTYSVWIDTSAIDLLTKIHTLCTADPWYMIDLYKRNTKDGCGNVSWT